MASTAAAFVIEEGLSAPVPRRTQWHKSAGADVWPAMLKKMGRGASRVLQSAVDGAHQQHLDDAEHPALVTLLGRAFAHHYPITLTPDDVLWPLVAAAATYLRENEAAMRTHVAHQGSVELSVLRSGAFEWPSVFDEWATLIRDHIGADMYERLRGQFSTTTPTAATSYSILLQDAFQKAFTYVLYTDCGIPSVRLLGTVDDWRRLCTQARSVAALLGDDAWLASVGDVVDNIAYTAMLQAGVGGIDPEPLRAFWRKAYLYGGGGDSGEKSQVSGWVNVFFPYTSTGRFVPKTSAEHPWGKRTDDEFTVTLASTPFSWVADGAPQWRLRATAGPVSVAHLADEGGALRIAWGWVVHEDGDAVVTHDSDNEGGSCDFGNSNSSNDMDV